MMRHADTYWTTQKLERELMVTRLVRESTLRRELGHNTPTDWRHGWRWLVGAVRQIAPFGADRDAALVAEPTRSLPA